MIDKLASGPTWAFYPMVIVFAAAMILISFGASIIPIEPAAQAGVSTRQGYVFGPAELAHIDPGSDQVLNAQRTWSGAIEAVQLATKRIAGPPTGARAGARLLLAPETARALQGHSLVVTVAYRQLYQNSAPQFALRLGSAPWMTQPLGLADGALHYTITAPAGAPPSALGLWPTPQSDQYYSSYGIQLMSVRIQVTQ